MLVGYLFGRGKDYFVLSQLIHCLAKNGVLHVMLVITLFLPSTLFTVIVTMYLPHQVVPNECSRINTVEDLVANFHCDRQTNSTDAAFHFLSWKYKFHKESTILVAYYRTADKDMTQMSKTGRYTSSEGRCSPSDTNSYRVYIIYSNPLFFVVLP